MIDTNRPQFVYISGSYALQKAKEINNINSNDIDLYIDVSHPDFNFPEVVKWLKEIHMLGYCIECQQRSLEYRLFHSYPDNIKKRIVETNLKMTYTEINMFYKKWVIDVAMGNYVETNEDPYLSETDFRVFKLINSSSDLLSLDIILINMPISDYINKFFDLSIVKNYIDSDNKLFCFNENHISNNICEYRFSHFRNRILNSYQANSFMKRILKYSNRGFKIYMTFYCDCEEINCEDSLRLSKENMLIIIQRLVSFNDSKFISKAKDPVEFLDNNYNKYIRNRYVAGVLKYSILYLRNLTELKKTLCSPKFIQLEAEEWYSESG